jgi:hypothetical protein
MADNFAARQSQQFHPDLKAIGDVGQNFRSDLSVAALSFHDPAQRDEFVGDCWIANGAAPSGLKPAPLWSAKGTTEDAANPMPSRFERARLLVAPNGPVEITSGFSRRP